MNDIENIKIVDTINLRMTEAATTSRIAVFGVVDAGVELSKKLRVASDQIKTIRDSMASEGDREEIDSILFAIASAMLAYHTEVDGFCATLEVDDAKTYALREQVSKVMGNF